MDLAGKYYNDKTDQTLYIDKADNSTGIFGGRLTWGGQYLKVEGRYGFQSEAVTFILFWARLDVSVHANYEVWTGYAKRSDYSQLRMIGARTFYDEQGEIFQAPTDGPWLRQG